MRVLLLLLLLGLVREVLERKVLRKMVVVRHERNIKRASDRDLMEE